MSWTHLRDENVKARKEHKCYLCGESILKGEKYIKRVGINEVFITMKMHVECELESLVWDSDDWECFSLYEMDRPLKESDNGK